MGKPDSTTFMGATPEQIAALADHMDRARGIGWLRRRGDTVLITDLMVYEVSGSTLTKPGQQNLAYEYAHELRRELARRKLFPVPSMRIPRCEVCSHGTERLFPTTEATHNIVSTHDESERIFPKVCVRCWSRLHVDTEDGE